MKLEKYSFYLYKKTYLFFYHPKIKTYYIRIYVKDNCLLTCVLIPLLTFPPRPIVQTMLLDLPWIQ